MSKLWVIVLGTAVAAVVAAGLYLNLTSTDAGISQAMASDPDALVVEVAADEHIIGDPNAPVTIVEYASLTCPHCAAFHTEILPEVKKQLLDTGKARLVYRDFPLGSAGLARLGPGALRFAVAAPSHAVAIVSNPGDLGTLAGPDGCFDPNWPWRWHVRGRCECLLAGSNRAGQGDRAAPGGRAKIQSCLHT